MTSHERNRAGYEGVLEIDDRLLADLLAAVRAVLAAHKQSPMPEADD